MNTNTIFRKLGILAGILCITIALILTIAYGLTIGNLLTFIFASLLIALSVWFRKLPSIWKRIITFTIAVGILFFITITTIVIVRGAHDTVTFKEECIIVLGCGIRGEKILPTLESRLNKCIEYHSHNPQALIVVSGGQGHNEDIPEAEAMKRYLLAHNISEAQIIVEDKSRNTKENFIYSKQLLDNHFKGKAYTIACITSDYHVLRAEKIAADNGINIHSFGAGIEWYLRPSAHSREALSICYYWLFR